MMAHQAFTPQVAAIEPDVFHCGSVDLPTDFTDTFFEGGSYDPAVEVLMVDSHRSPPGFRRSGGNGGGDGPSYSHEEYQPQPLSSQQRASLQ